MKWERELALGLSANAKEYLCELTLVVESDARGCATTQARTAMVGAGRIPAEMTLASSAIMVRTGQLAEFMF